ncbi:MAG: hypothetical protein R3E31_02720 [Chloroflexota bacterium]
MDSGKSLKKMARCMPLSRISKCLFAFGYLKIIPAFTKEKKANMNNQGNNKSEQNIIGAGLAIGAGLGLIFGSAIGNVGAGLVIGIAAGIGFATGQQRKKKSE